jgi:hypothetical protein
VPLTLEENFHPNIFYLSGTTKNGNIKNTNRKSETRQIQTKTQENAKETNKH